MQPSSRLPVALALALALASCASDRASRREDPPPTAAPPGAGLERLQPPLDLDLRGIDWGDGRAEIVATVRVSGRLAAPPVLRIDLPAGAALAEGLAAETLQAPGTAVTYERRWIVTGLAGRATVSVESAGRAAGARSQASWPTCAAAPPPAAPESRPVPATEVHGVKVDQAIPLEPARKP